MDQPAPTQPPGSGPAGEAVAGSGASPGWWAAQRQAWLQRRQAAVVCRRLCAMYRACRSRNPGLGGRALYRCVVAEHGRLDEAGAERLLQFAEASYALWPVQRSLTFRDVVHYLAVAELFTAGADTPGIHANVKRVVDAAIPADA